MKYRELKFRNLPFTPSKRQVIYIENTYDDTINGYIKENISQLKGLFNRNNLEDSPSYQNGDVLWITDFLIPLPEKSMLHRLQQHRKDGTRFYGFQIGIEPTPWSRYMDKIYKVEYKIPKRF